MPVTQCNDSGLGAVSCKHGLVVENVDSVGGLKRLSKDGSETTALPPVPTVSAKGESSSARRTMGLIGWNWVNHVPVQKGNMTAEFRLVLCEPATIARVKAAIKRKATLARGKWHGPLQPFRDEWQKWYDNQRGVIIPLTQEETKPKRGKKAA